MPKPSKTIILLVSYVKSKHYCSHYKGKYFQIQFNYEGDPTGGRITNCTTHFRVYNLLKTFWKSLVLLVRLKMNEISISSINY